MLQFVCVLLLVSGSIGFPPGFNPLSISQMLSSQKKGEEERESDKACIVNENETSWCTYSNIMDSYGFHSDLLYFTNRTKAALIRKMNFEESFMDNIPKELFTIYKNLEVLDVSHTNLERLESYDFMSNGVRIFNASNNQIYKLGARMLKDMKNLTSLDLSHNIIDRMNPSTFSEISSFKFLNLSHNAIKRLDLRFFSPLKSLEVLKLDHNMISEISGDFRNLHPQWSELYLQHNQLKSIDPLLIASLSVLDLSLNGLLNANFENSKLVELLINHNQLKTLQINKNLESLSLSGNNDNAVNILFEDNTSLKHLDISYCELKSMKSVMTAINRFKDLEHLDLTETQVELPENAFKGLSKLKTLKLARSVKDRSENVFFNLSSLVELDYSGNIHPVSFDLRELELSKNLEILNLKSCSLLELRNWQNVSTLLPKLQKVYLYENNLICEELDDISTEFKRLKIITEETNDIENGLLLTSTCVNATNFKPVSPRVEGETSPAFLWYSPAVVLLLCIVAGVLYAHKKFSIFSGALECIKRKHSSYSDELLRGEN